MKYKTEQKNIEGIEVRVKSTNLAAFNFSANINVVCQFAYQLAVDKNADDANEEAQNDEGTSLAP